MGLGGPLGVFADAVLGKMLDLEAAEVAYHKAIGAQVVEEIGATCVVNPGLPHPAFNAASSLDAEGQDTTAFVQRMELAYAHERLPFQVVCTPITRPPELEAAILDRGYVVASKRTWMELMVAPPTEPDDPRLEVRVEEDAQRWAHLAAIGIETPAAQPLLARLGKATLEAPGHTLLTASFAGQPAGACEVSVDEGIAVIRRLAVAAPFRPRPVARALLHHACKAAYGSDAFRVLLRVFEGTGAEPLFESYGFVGVQISTELVREFPAFLLD
jgi:GNAT superfamily N-acetyltransferase